MSPVLTLPVLVVALSAWCLISVRMAGGPGPTVPGFWGALAAGMAGASLLLGAALLGARVSGEVALLSVGLFGALLMISAWADHRTAFAPDGLLLPLLFGAVAVPLPEREQGAGPLGAALIAALVFLSAQLLWRLQGRRGFRLLTPPDLCVLLLPLLTFGVSPDAWATYLLMCVPLTLLLGLPEPIYQRLRGPATEEAVVDAGLSGSGRSAPLLPIALGALGLMIVIELVWR